MVALRVKCMDQGMADTKIPRCFWELFYRSDQVFLVLSQGEKKKKSKKRITFDLNANHVCFQQILREVPASDIVLTQCVMSRSGRMLFAGTSSGTLRAMKFPLTVPGEWQEHQVHSKPITKVTKSRILFTNLNYTNETKRGTIYSNENILKIRILTLGKI